MPHVIEMPIDRLSDQELGLRKWEAVMSGGYGSAEHRRVECEILRRMSGPDDSRPASLH